MGRCGERQVGDGLSESLGHVLGSENFLATTRDVLTLVRMCEEILARELQLSGILNEHDSLGVEFHLRRCATHFGNDESSVSE